MSFVNALSLSIALAIGVSATIAEAAPSPGANFNRAVTAPIPGWHHAGNFADWAPCRDKGEAWTKYTGYPYDCRWDNGERHWELWIWV